MAVGMMMFLLLVFLVGFLFGSHRNTGNGKKNKRKDQTKTQDIRIHTLAMASHQRRLHAIVLPFPSDGHIIPLLHLSKILLATGFSITFVSNQANHQRLLHTAKQSGTSLHQNPDFKFVALAGLSQQESAKLAGLKGVELGIACVDNMKKPFEDILEDQLSRESVDCIIDSYIYWVGDVADRFGIIRAAFFPSNSSTDFVVQSLPELIRLGLIPIKDPSASSKIAIPFPGDLPLTQSDIPILFQEEGPVLDFILKCKLRSKDWALANTFEELESKVISEMRTKFQNYLPVGPVHAYQINQILDSKIGLTEEDRSCLKWLDMQAPESVLYVSFGSKSVVSKDQLKKIAEGVRSSKTPFLWVQRPDLAGEEEGMDWIFEWLNPEQGMVVKWAPQTEVLMHSAVGGFLSHCGWNSTLESICAGVPMLGWPLSADQNLNSKLMVEEWKIGLDFRGVERDGDGFVSAHDVKNGVLRVIEGEEGRGFRVKIREIRDSGLTASLPHGSSKKNVQVFADALLSRGI